jgi:hypothetical protein
MQFNVGITAAGLHFVSPNGHGMIQADRLVEIETPPLHVTVKNLFIALSLATLTAASTASALVLGLTPSSPLQGFDLGAGEYATLLGIQVPTGSLVGQTIALDNLNASIVYGAAEFYHAAGSSETANFGSVTPFAPFVSGVVQAGSGSPNLLSNSIYAVHTSSVGFANGTGGGAPNTISIEGERTVANPFTSSSSTSSSIVTAQELPTTNNVPEGGTTIALFGAALAGLALLRRKFRA